MTDRDDALREYIQRLEGELEVAEVLVGVVVVILVAMIVAATFLMIFAFR